MCYLICIHVFCLTVLTSGTHEREISGWGNNITSEAENNFNFDEEDEEKFEWRNTTNDAATTSSVTATFNGIASGIFNDFYYKINNKIVIEREIFGWGKTKSRDPKKYVNQFKDTTIINNQICEDNVKLAIVVTSAPHEFKSRTIVRKTWASKLPKQMKIGFLLGAVDNVGIQNGIFQESLEYKDIIQDSFVDSYYNLTLKSISMLKWFIRNCPKVQFLMKVDIDTYLSIERLVDVLNKTGNGTGILLGHKDHGSPIRNLNSKWYIPRYLYRGNMFPEFIRGKAYLMSRDVVEKLYAAAWKTPIINLEDVYVTGLCAKNAGVTPKGLGGMLRECFPKPFKGSFIACHPASTDVLQYLWDLENSKGWAFNKTIMSSTYKKTISSTKPSSACHRMQIIPIVGHQDAAQRSFGNHQTVQYCVMATSFMMLAIIIHHYPW